MTKVKVGVLRQHAPLDRRHMALLEITGLGKTYGQGDQVETKELPEFSHLRAHVYRLIKRRSEPSTVPAA